MHPALSEVRQTGTRFVMGPALATVIGTMSLSTRISQEILDYLQTILDLGGTITGGSDDNLATFRVLK
jgi:hypothetical protein